jgi:hypothetical protein
MQKWMEEPDYYKETMKQYYQKFNLPEPKVINVVMNSDFDFGAHRRIDKIEFDSFAKEFKENQFEAIRFDSGPHADEIIPLTSLIPLVKQYTNKKLAHEFSKILKGHN